MAKRSNIVRESRLHTDESKLYSNVGKEFSAHETTVHSRGEYVGGDVHTNSVGFFSIFKHGMRSLYQHCKEKHLHRYLAKVRFPIQLTQNHGYGAHNSGGARVSASPIINLTSGSCAADASGAEPSYALICAIRRSVSECL